MDYKQEETVMQIADMARNVVEDDEIPPGRKVFFDREKKLKAEGRAEGRAEGMFDVAKNMKEKNIPFSVISEVTGISIFKIKKL